MKLALIGLTEEDIQISTNRVSDETSSFVMYLQNNGIENFRWNTDEFTPWINEDIED